MPDRKKTASDEVLLSSSQIGCCGLYHECSTSMHCIANPDTASRCIYRKTLESGISYYGKTAASFDAARYDRLVQAFQSLSDPDRQAFSQLIYSFVLKKRLAERILFYLSDIPEHLISSGLIITDTDPYDILQSFNYRYLKSRIPSLPVSKEAGILKLCNDHPDFVAVETSRFVYVRLPEPFNLYDELLRDFFPKNFSFSLSFPEKNEECFVQQR